MSGNSDASDFFWFIVKCVLGPRMPSFFTTLFEMKLVFERLSSIARPSVKFPFWPLLFTFWTGQIAGTLVLPWTLRLLASWLSFLDGSVLIRDLNLQELHGHCVRKDGGVAYTYRKRYRRAFYKSLYDGLVGIFDSRIVLFYNFPFFINCWLLVHRTCGK